MKVGNTSPDNLQQVKADYSQVAPSRLGFGVGLVAIAGVCYGIPSVLVKWAYENGANPITVLTVRSGVAMAAIWLVVAFVRPNVRLPLNRVGGISVLGLLFVFSGLAYYGALERISVGTAVLVAYTFPALVVLGAAIFYRERLNQTKLLALVLALSGCFLTIDPVQALGSSQKFDWLGILIAFGSALCNAGYVLLSLKFGRGLPGLVVAAYSMPVNALFYGVWCLLGGGFALNMTLLGWLCCVAIGLLISLAWILYFVGVPHIGPGRAAIVITTEPASAVLLGILLLGEPLSPLKLLGGALIFGAIYLLRG